MSGRLLNQPVCLEVVGFQPLNGPATLGSVGGSLSSYAQTVVSYGFAWEFEITVNATHRRMAREVRGWLTANHSGANATRFKLVDGDWPQPEELGLAADVLTAKPFAEGQVLTEGKAISGGYGLCKMKQAAALGATIVQMEEELWYDKLTIGTWIGFHPFHLAGYQITEVRGNGEYRIYPPLRKAVAADDYATLTPVFALRQMGEGAYPFRNQSFQDQVKLRFLEVFDYDVRDYFVDG